MRINNIRFVNMLQKEASWGEAWNVAKDIGGMVGGDMLGRSASSRGRSNYGYDEHYELMDKLNFDPMVPTLGGAAAGGLMGYSFGKSPKSILLGAGIGGLAGYLGNRMLR